MNERIESLIELAEVWNTEGDVDVDLYKFAELIVKECANIANGGIDPNEDYLIGDNILKHFGVEE